MLLERGIELRVDIPAIPSEGWVQGYVPGTCSIIVSQPGGRDATATMCSIISCILGTRTDICVIVLGSFEENLTAACPALCESAHGIGGAPAHRMGDPAGIGAVIGLNAEGILLFACDEAGVRSAAARPDQAPVPWWKYKPRSASDVGQLTGATDVIGPLVWYSGSHESIEVLGSESQISESLARIRACPEPPNPVSQRGAPG
jgi:hypothetical protein